MTISLDKSQEIYRKKLLKVINEFSKNAGYKVNIQKSIVFLHTSNDQLETQVFQNDHLQ